MNTIDILMEVNRRGIENGQYDILPNYREDMCGEIAEYLREYTDSEIEEDNRESLPFTEGNHLLITFCDEWDSNPFEDLSPRPMMRFRNNEGLAIDVYQFED